MKLSTCYNNYFKPGSLGSCEELISRWHHCRFGDKKRKKNESCTSILLLLVFTCSSRWKNGPKENKAVACGLWFLIALRCKTKVGGLWWSPLPPLVSPFLTLWVDTDRPLTSHDSLTRTGKRDQCASKIRLLCTWMFIYSSKDESMWMQDPSCCFSCWCGPPSVVDGEFIDLDW